MRGGVLIGAGLCLLAVLTAAAIVLPTTAAVGLVLALAGLIAGLVAPVRIVAVAWGLLLPTYTIGTLPPEVFDAIRYAGVVLLLVRVRSDLNDGEKRHVTGWAVLIGVLGAARLGMSLPRDDMYGTVSGVVTLVALAAALVVVGRKQLHLPVLVGYTAGVTASAVVVVLQAAGLPNPTVPREGTLRIVGLSAQSTLLTYQLAIAVVLMAAVLIGRLRAPRLMVVLSLMVCLAAMALSGGRGGILGLAFAAVFVGLRYGYLRVAHVLGLVALGAAVWWFLDRAQLYTLTLDRLSGPAGGESSLDRLSSGRLDIAGRAFAEILADPLFGPGIGQFRTEHTLVPHFMPLTIGLTAGVAGLVLGFVVLGRLTGVVLRRPPVVDGRFVVGAALCAVLLANSLTEPTGPFSGVERVTILLIALLMCAPTNQRAEESTERVRGSRGRS